MKAKLKPNGLSKKGKPGKKSKHNGQISMKALKPKKSIVKENGSKSNGMNAKMKRKHDRATDRNMSIDDEMDLKKKPSKFQQKAIIEALKKDADLMTVRKALKYVPYYLKSEGLTKKLLKEIIRLWSESGEKIRVICLLCLIRIYTKISDKERRQTIIKNLYTTFLSKCGIAKFETMSMISFMRHSLIELYKIDPHIAHKQAQTACQQLSTSLQNATKHKNEESYKSVLNWRFANCLILLSQLITSQGDESPVKKLTQQVIDLNIDAINLLQSPRYYPYYCHIIENLIHLSISAKVFIPILPMMLNILKRLSFPLEKKLKQKEVSNAKKTSAKSDSESSSEDEDEDENENSHDDNESEDDEDNKDSHDEEDEEDDENERNGDSNDDESDDLEGEFEHIGRKQKEKQKEKPKKDYNIELLNHVNLEEAHTAEYQSAVVSKLYDLMLLYLASQCHKIAFSELVFLPCVHIKKWLKTNPGKPAQRFKTLLERIKSDCDKSDQARNSIDFAFTNYRAVDAWEKKLLDSNKLSLPKLLQSNKEHDE